MVSKQKIDCTSRKNSSGDEGRERETVVEYGSVHRLDARVDSR